METDHEMSSFEELQASYSRLVDVAGRLVRDEVASLLSVLQHGDAADDSVTTAGRLCALSQFSESVAQSIHIKLLPVLRGMIQSQNETVVNRASTAVAVLCAESPHLACMVFATGLLGCIINRLAPRPPSLDDERRSPRAPPVSPIVKLCMLEMLVALSTPSYEESPYSILLAVRNHA